MTQFELDFTLEQPLMSSPARPAFMGVQELLDRIDADDDLPASRHRDYRSAVHRLVKIMGYEDRPQDLTLKPAEIRAAVNDVTAAQIGVTDKCLSNLRSNIAAVIKRYLLSPCSLASDLPLSPAWQRLHESSKGDRDLNYSLMRFMRYCTAMGVIPGAVTVQTLKEYMAWVEATVPLKDPQRIQRQTRNAWNRAMQKVPGWPQRELENPRPSTAYCFKLEEYPESFQSDVAAWLALLQADDPFNDDAPAKPLKPSSIKTRMFQVRQIASAMVRQGRPMADFKRLSDLLDLDWVAEMLDFMSARTTGKPSHQKSALLYVLIIIAKHWVHADERTIRLLQKARKAQSPKADSMPSKNRERLAALQCEDKLVDLVCLPQRLLSEVSAGKLKGQKADTALEAALLIEILLMYPLRLKNLAALTLGSQIKVIGAGAKRRLQVMVPVDEVKNGMPLLATLPPESMAIFDAYMERARPRFSNEAGDWLFPGGKPGAHKAGSNLSKRVKRTIKEYLGLTLNVHAFRHVDTMIYLMDRPGHYEDVRRILAHTNTETVAKYYADLEVQPAVDRLHDSVLGIRNMGRKP